MVPSPVSMQTRSRGRVSPRSTDNPPWIIRYCTVLFYYRQFGCIHIFLIWQKRSIVITDTEKLRNGYNSSWKLRNVNNPSWYTVQLTILPGICCPYKSLDIWLKYRKADSPPWKLVIFWQSFLNSLVLVRSKRHLLI